MKTTLTRILIFTLVAMLLLTAIACGKNPDKDPGDRKSTRLNSSH